MTVENIIKIYDMATPEEKRNGVIWYAEALAACSRIGLDNGVPLHIVVGVCAALSPNNKWDRNVVNTREMVQAFINGDDMDSFKVSTYHAMKSKAWGILEAMPETEEEVMVLLNGQKIVSFFQNIMGHDTCTVDGHARNIAYGVREGLTGSITIGKIEYKRLQEE